MEHLLCVETMNREDTRRAQLDPVIYKGPLVLKNLLLDQDVSLPNCNYFKEFQTDIQPFMRKVVTSWMLEVCEDQRCEVQILPLATNIMDRFLCTSDIKRGQLQLTGATCLLIASKTRQSSHLPVDLLCYYTDNSITPIDLRHWEIMVLTKLRWRIYAVTGSDFMEHLLELIQHKSAPQIRNHAHTLLSLACTEPDLMMTKGSVLAVASLVSAARGIKSDDSMSSKLSTVIGSPIEEIESVVDRIELIFIKACKALNLVGLDNEQYLSHPPGTSYDICYVD